MTNILTGLSFLLLGLRELGVALDGTLLGIIFIITAALWILSAAGVPVPGWHRTNA
jgi:hypothetical protein